MRNLKDCAEKEGLSIWTMHRIRDLYFKGNTLYSIQIELNLGQRKVKRITEWLVHGESKKNQSKSFRANKIQYWKNEDEMIVQDYKAEELTGEEKLIFDKL